MSEPAIHVRRLTGSQVWSMEKLENKLIDMREMYQEYKDRPLSMVNKFLFLPQPALYNPSLHKSLLLTHSGASHFIANKLTSRLRSNCWNRLKMMTNR